MIEQIKEMMREEDSSISANNLKYQPHITYTFDVAPNDTYQYLSAPKQSLADYDRLEQFVKHSKKLISEISLHDIEIHVQVEISRPVNGERKTCARLHWHGLIRFGSLDAIIWFDLYGLTLLFKFGTVKIDTIDDMRKRYRYMIKDRILGFPQFGHPNGFLYLMLDKSQMTDPPDKNVVNIEQKNKTRVKRRRKPITSVHEEILTTQELIEARTRKYYNLT